MSLDYSKKKITQLFPYNLNFFHNLLKKQKEEEMKKDINTNLIKIPLIKIRKKKKLNENNDEETIKEKNVVKK